MFGLPIIIHLTYLLNVHYDPSTTKEISTIKDLKEKKFAHIKLYSSHSPFKMTNYFPGSKM